jgi:hypothetical protein
MQGVCLNQAGASGEERDVDLRAISAYLDSGAARLKRCQEVWVKGNAMDSFDDRKRAQEAKFARDASLKFKAEARRNRLLGLWAAERMGLEGESAAAYAKEVVASDFEEAGDEDVFRKVHGDLEAKGAKVTDAEIREQMARLMVVAGEQVMTEG